MPTTDWERLLSNFLKAELKVKGMTYGELAERLAALGVHEKEANIANKLSRGRFSAVFLAQCLQAIESEKLRLD
ncbi:DUF6471 domain-containing protein [Mesorhizobium sp.]|uniref:DUF6471 domain-containing protein n=1 Tax=Mesorhizobium sp. TaxID=1871066 RepID=UPI0012126B93|nr:DUF6471 domain-containing protein [Mesorhizobium sp.]TIO35039.1 MAG: hypothetical protein E5X89_10980 [Mesorhizobium sp.]